MSKIKEEITGSSLGAIRLIVDNTKSSNITTRSAILENQMELPKMSIGNNTSSIGGINKKDDIMTNNESSLEIANMTREELDAKLAQNKAEVQAIASGMREEMAHWREEQNAQMGKIITTLSVLDVKLDERYENQKTASTRTQWMIGITIAVAAIIPAVIALLK